MIDETKRWIGARVWQLSGRAERNRAELYNGAAGLRILVFHDPGPGLKTLQRAVRWCAARGELATPADADAIRAGSWPHGHRDRLLITFDDGVESNLEAARWLASVGVSAIFFVVPSLIGRTIAEYLAYHRARGVTAHPPVPDPSARGLSPAQVRELLAMGHRVGAHNFAHRDLGRLHERADLEYEIDRALEGVSELTGSRCDDFAIAFGQPENVSDEAAAFLLARSARVYSAHRGLNVPGLTPRFLLRDSVESVHPFAFTRVCLSGGADHHLADRARRMASRVGVLPVADRLPSSSK